MENEDCFVNEWDKHWDGGLCGARMIYCKFFFFSGTLYEFYSPSLSFASVPGSRVQFTPLQRYSSSCTRCALFIAGSPSAAAVLLLSEEDRIDVKFNRKCSGCVRYNIGGWMERVMRHGEDAAVRQRM